ncbi:unnamed protein product [Heterobilharzia americana]|nr:unnamed protein product [Heterobilharzia americana]
MEVQPNEDEDIVQWTTALHQSINSLKTKQFGEILMKLNTVKGHKFKESVINYFIDGASSIYVAVEAGFEQAVTQLLNTGVVNVTQRNQQNSWTCLHLACHLGLATIVKSILSFHSEENSTQLSKFYQLICMQTSETESTNEGTALHLAVQSKNLETVNQLLYDTSMISKHCMNRGVEREKKPEGKLFEEFCTLTDKDGNTALHNAVTDRLCFLVIGNVTILSNDINE